MCGVRDAIPLRQSAVFVRVFVRVRCEGGSTDLWKARRGREEKEREGRVAVVREHSKHETAAELPRRSWHIGQGIVILF